MRLLKNTHVSGLVPSVMPHVIHHAGEQAQAGWDVVREQEDAEGLKDKPQRRSLQLRAAHTGLSWEVTGVALVRAL